MGECNYNLNRYSSFPGNLLTHDPALLGWLLAPLLTSWNTLSQLMLTASDAWSYRKMEKHFLLQVCAADQPFSHLCPKFRADGWCSNFLCLGMLALCI